MLASGGDDKVVMIWKKSAYGGGGSLLGSKVKQVWSIKQLFLLIFTSREAAWSREGVGWHCSLDDCLIGHVKLHISHACWDIRLT